MFPNKIPIKEMVSVYLNQVKHFPNHLNLANKVLTLAAGAEIYPEQREAFFEMLNHFPSTNEVHVIQSASQIATWALLVSASPHEKDC